MQEPIIPPDCDDEYYVDYLFDLNGYLILKDAIAPEDVAALNQWIDDHWEYVEQGAEQGTPETAGQWIGNVETHTYQGADGLNFQNVIEAGEVFEKLIDYPAWTDRIQRYVNPVNGLSIHENLITVRGKGGYIGPHCGGHLSIIYMTFRQPNTGEWMVGQINVFMALTDIGPGDGGTMVVPGSHKSNFEHPHLSTYRMGKNSSGEGMEGAIEVEMKAGDALLFVDAMCHGSAKRATPGTRRIVVYRYGPSWGNFRYGYEPSPELLARLNPEARQIVRPLQLMPREPNRKN